MIIQENKYLYDFYGVYRDIIFQPETNTMILYFDAYLNDDLCIEYRKKYSTKDAALAEITKFISLEKEDTTKIGYSEESIRKINISIRNFMKAIIENKVRLPGRGYKYMGDKNYLQHHIDKNANFVFYR